MLGTAPSGSVQLQDYCVRPEKNGEPFFQSLSAFASDPSRHTEVPGYTYSALSKRNLAPRPFHQEDQPTVVPGNRLHWVQMPSKQRIIPAEVAVPCISRLNLHPSQTESCSRRNRCSNRYPILRRYKDLAPQHFWDGLMTGRNLSPHSQGSWAGQHEAAVTASRNSHGSSAACQAIFQIFKDRYSSPSIRTVMASSWAQGGGAPARRCTSYSSDAASALELMKSSSSFRASSASVRYAFR